MDLQTQREVSESAIEPRVLTAAEQEAIRRLAADIPALWAAPTTTITERKEILRHVVDRVVIEAQGASERQQWREFFAALPYWEISAEASIQAGIWRYEFSRRGIQLSTTGALVAAVAWEHQATLITNNTTHYPMPGLQLMSARE
jgi:predicted nucleic acid-binding protein